MQLKKLFLLLLLLLSFFVGANIANAASSCSGQFGSWCGPQSSNENCCNAEQCTGGSCGSTYPGCGQYGANARIGQCDYKCLEGVLRLVQCDHNYATGTNCSSNISNGQILDIGYCNYYCGNGTLQVNSCTSPIQSNSSQSSSYLCHSDGSCTGSLLPGDTGCRYRVFNGQAVREYSRIWTEAMCPPSSTNPVDLTCTDGNGVEHQDGTWWQEGGCARQCDAGVTVPNVCPLDQCYIAPKLLGGVYLEGKYVDSGTLAFLGEAECDNLCPQNQYDAWACTGTCYDGSWTGVYDCQYKTPYELNSCTATCPNDAWSCNCPTECNQSTTTPNDTCGGVAPLSCGTHSDNTIWNENFCNYRCDNGVTTKIESSCSYPNNHLCEQAKPEQCQSNYCEYDPSLEEFFCKDEPLPDLSCTVGNGTLQNGESAYYSSAICSPYCTDSTNEPATTCSIRCENGDASLDPSGGCVYPPTELATCTETCTANAGCVCSNTCNASGEIVKGENCGGNIPQNCGFIAHGETGSTSGSTCYDGGCQTNLNGSPPTSCSVTCDDGDYVNATSCVYPKKSLGSCGATCDATFGCYCPSECTNDQITVGQSCGGIPYDNCSIDGYSDLAHGNTGHYFTFTDSSGTHTPCASYCTNQTNLDATSCDLSCNDGSLSLVGNSCVYPRTPLTSCTQLCTADAGCACPTNCSTSGNIAKNTTCGGDVRQDCDLSADGLNATLTSSRCYDAGCAVNTNGPLPSSCTATCSDGEYINATYCTYPLKSLGTCDATCDATFGCGCPNICTNDEISLNQSCGGIPYQACSIDGYADLGHGDTKHYFSYIDTLGLHDPCANYCTNQTNLPAVGCNLSCNDGDLSLINNSCEYPRTPLNSCTQICTASAGCICPDNCVKEGNIAQYAACGGDVPQDCDLAANGQKATLTSQRCYDAGCEVNTNGNVPSSCTATCNDGKYVNATACVYPKKSLGSCDATCDATFGCSCPSICTNDQITLGEDCGGELHPACKIDGYSDLEHGETGFYFNYTDALGEHTPCASYCTNQTNLPAEECYLSCTDGQLSLRNNNESACNYPQTPVENCTEECAADAGCTCSEECVETGSIKQGEICGDPIPNCTSIATSRCSLDGNYSEYCLIPGLDPVTRTLCEYQCNENTHKCNLAPNGTACTASSQCQSDICFEGVCTNAIGGAEPATTTAYCPDYNDNREYCEQVEGCEYKSETNKCVPSGSQTFCDIESPGICGGTLYDCTTLHGFEDTCNAIAGCTYNTDEGICLNDPKTAVGTWCPTPNNEPAVCLPNPDLAGTQYSDVCACINEFGDDVLKPYGIPCDENSECYSNYCAPQSPTRPEYKTCIDRPVPEPIPEPIATDESCHPSSAYLCESRICEPKEEQDLLCVTACTTQILTTEELNACLDDCNVTSYVCAEKPPKSSGQICTTDEECESLICSGNEVTPGICEPIVQCTTHERCREYFGSDAYGCNVSQRMCERIQTPAPPPTTSSVFCPALSFTDCEEYSECEFRLFDSMPNPGGLIDPIPGAGVCVNKDWPQSCDNIYSSSACRYEDSMVDHGKYTGDTCNLTTSESAYCVPSEREENGGIAYYNVCYCSDTSGIENYQVFAKQFCPSDARFGCQCLHDNLNVGHVSTIAPGEYCSPTVEKNVLCTQTEHGESCWCPSLEGHGILVPIETNLIQAGEVCGECNPDVILSCLDEAIADGNLARIFDEIGTAFMFGFNRSEAGQEFANNIVNHMFDDSRPTLERIGIAIEDGMNLAVNLLTFWGVETTYDLTTEMQACLDTNRGQILGSAPESDSLIATMSSAFEQTISLCGGQIVSTYISGVLTSIDIGQISKGILNSFNGVKLAEQLVEKIEPRLLRIGWVADIVDNAPYIKPNELLRLADEAGISVSDAFTFANTKNLINSNIIKYQFGDSVSILVDDVIRYSIQNLEKISFETLTNMASAGAKLSLEQFENVVENKLLLTTIDAGDDVLAIRYKYYQELKARNLLDPEVDYYFQGGGGNITIIDHIKAALGGNYSDDLIIDGVDIIGDTAYNSTPRYNDFAMADATSKVRQYINFDNQDYLDTIKLYFEHPELNIRVQKIIVDEGTDTIIGLQMERRGITLLEYGQSYRVKISDDAINQLITNYEDWISGGVPPNRNIRLRNIVLEVEDGDVVAIWLDDYSIDASQNIADDYLKDVANLRDIFDVVNFAVTHDGANPNAFNFLDINLVLDYAIRNGELTQFELDRMAAAGAKLTPDDFLEIYNNQLLGDTYDEVDIRNILLSKNLLDGNRFYLIDEGILNLRNVSTVDTDSLYYVGRGTFGVVYKDPNNPNLVNKILNKPVPISKFDLAYYKYDKRSFAALVDATNDPTAQSLVNGLQLSYYLRIEESGLQVSNTAFIRNVIVNDSGEIVGWSIDNLVGYADLFDIIKEYERNNSLFDLQELMDNVVNTVDQYQRQTGAVYGVNRKKGGDIIHALVASDTGAPTFNYGNIVINRVDPSGNISININDIRIIDQYESDLFDFTDFSKGIAPTADLELSAARQAADDIIQRNAAPPALIERVQ